MKNRVKYIAERLKRRILIRLAKKKQLVYECAMPNEHWSCYY
jgi:hypothetical protein